MLSISYVNFWNDKNNDRYLSKFIDENIGKTKEIHYNNNPDILISSCMGNINVKNIKSKCKIFFYGENLNRSCYRLYNNETLLYNTFDIIIGFKDTNIDKKQIRFPIWLIYYPFYNFKSENNIINYLNNKYRENIKKNKIYFGSMVCKHDRGGQRTLLYNELSKYGNIYCPSLFKNNINKIGNSSCDKINFISNSIYNICPENSKFENYYTEKIFQSLEAGCIPLYWAIDLPEQKILNNNCYCFIDLEKDNIEEKIKYLVNNKEKYIVDNIFNDNAKSEIENMYNSLINEIKKFI